MEEKDDAVAFDYPNSQYPYPKPHIYYGNQYVPSPTNERAKMVDREKIMRQVNEGK